GCLPACTQYVPDEKHVLRNPRLEGRQGALRCGVAEYLHPLAPGLAASFRAGGDDPDWKVARKLGSEVIDEAARRLAAVAGDREGGRDQYQSAACGHGESNGVATDPVNAGRPGPASSPASRRSGW